MKISIECNIENVETYTGKNGFGANITVSQLVDRKRQLLTFNTSNAEYANIDVLFLIWTCFKYKINKDGGRSTRGRLEGEIKNMHIDDSLFPFSEEEMEEIEMDLFPNYTEEEIEEFYSDLY